ncbi:hypothetical protein AWC29_29485 [Mycobacterium triplex]|uniref:Peptidase S8/S53 subtilisin kexin sedolisin n=1 Tax=Mycobacterium triplex TaxID=47839 RepID=A0A024JQS6_9MYCO|nr:S8 family peptidase [Mycobacterium triplex]ORW99113.1 hypothetical protein AWC29_29485 [Mycobacterium triplex]CDO86180.1 peptidase S8/S53 subtilisin kexin sedolisin [Mycobacterium triplex]
MTEETSISRKLVDYILVGTGPGRRHLQGSPILGDVWTAYVQDLSKPVDLLITSHKGTTANDLAAEIFSQLQKIRSGIAHDDDPRVAPVQNYVAARLYFDEVIRVLIPMTQWWLDPRTRNEFDAWLNSGESAAESGSDRITQTLDDVRVLVDAWNKGPSFVDDLVNDPTAGIRNRRTAFERFVALCTLVLMVQRPPEETDRKPMAQANLTRIQRKDQGLLVDTSRDELRELVVDLISTDMSPAKEAKVWQISRNRPASTAIMKSVPTVKADAARRLFELDGSGITWAVIDSGIYTQHGAFGQHPIRKTYDFTYYREVVNLSNVDDVVRKRNLATIEAARGNTLPSGADRKLKQIAKAACRREPMRYDLIKEFLELGDGDTPPPRPSSDHGTHVAGIIAASVDETGQKLVTGMCPGIGLYDLRIIGSDKEDTELAVIAALQFVRRTNELAGDMQIQGVNMSLSIEHDVRNYACGATPVCMEAERLVDSGVVVVAAAGNFGYQNIVVNDQPFNNYLAFSITDPGNADRVITVGSTHHYKPFTYGVSYFSSRGPTGDGRLKPDLVAPGERIYSSVLDDDWGYLDGTSMAAPHVSGAAALLMARYPELVGQPDKIKKILCETATDLGRERNFQGHGLLDVLRALQSQ